MLLDELIHVSFAIPAYGEPAGRAQHLNNVLLNALPFEDSAIQSMVDDARVSQVIQVCVVRFTQLLIHWLNPSPDHARRRNKLQNATDPLESTCESLVAR